VGVRSVLGFRFLLVGRYSLSLISCVSFFWTPDLSLSLYPRFFVAAAGTNHKGQIGKQQQEGEAKTRGEVRRERSKNRSHVVEIKAFSCLPGASYPSLSDLAFQHRHTVLLLLPPLPCLGLNKKTILAEQNNTHDAHNKVLPSFSRQQVSVFKYTKAFGLSEALIIITITITIMSVNGLQKNFNLQNSRI
jgi:hypothetical protein